MRSDVEGILRERGIDALVVPLHELQHSSFRWLSRGARVTRGYVVVVAGNEPVLLYDPMERDEAVATGVPARSLHEFDYPRYIREFPPGEAHGRFLDSALRALGARGHTLAIAGHVPAHLYFNVVAQMRCSGWWLYDSSGEDLLQLARKSKDEYEMREITSVGERTERVVERVRAALRRAELRDGLAFLDGSPLMIGQLKTIVTSGIAEEGMIEDHETILSQGRDAGVPHSRGDAGAQVRASVPIVLDIFPCDRASGYFFDLTRTFCIGAIPDRLREVHADVREAFLSAASHMRAGTPAAAWQHHVCDLFEAKGHPTIRTDPSTTRGYVHSLGHGVGLDVHERPSFSASPANQDRVEIHDVLTIEPGLYFPDEEIGVRIEDTFRIDAEGRAVSLARGSIELEP